MTAMREEAFELLEQMPEDKLVFIIQIMHKPESEDEKAVTIDE